MGIRKFLFSAVSFIALQGAITSLLLFSYYRPSINGVSAVYSSTQLKHRRLKSSASPRAIFVGGSNLFYGLESELIKEQTGYEPVNMGLVGGLRISYFLNEVKDSLEAGDIVVLALEYIQLTATDEHAAPQVLMRVIEQRPQSVQYLNLVHLKLLFDRGIQEHVGISLRSSLGRIPEHPPFLLTTPQREENKDINVYGDLVRFREGPPPHKGGIQQVLPPTVHQQNLKLRVRQLNQFYRYCQLNGVDVVFSYPPIPSSQYTNQAEIAQEFHKELEANLEIPIIHQPQDMVFDTSNFINESYHLHGPAIRQRTQRLINDLASHEQREQTVADN